MTWPRGAEKQATKPHRGLRCLFTHIPQLNVSRRETHYEMLLSQWVWIEHVKGVCASVFKCALFIWGMSPVCPVEWSCIETGEQVSPQPSSDTERPRLRADSYISHSLHFTLLTRRSVFDREKLTCRELKVDASRKVHMCRCVAAPKFEKHIFSFERSNETVNPPRAKVKRDNRAVIKIYGCSMTG